MRSLTQICKIIRLFPSYAYNYNRYNGLENYSVVLLNETIGTIGPK